MDRWSLNEALLAAVTANDCAGVRELLAQGADPDGARAQLGHPALHLAAGWGQIEIVDLLIGAGARVEGESELWEAASQGHWEIVQALLAGGASIEANPEFSNCGSILFAALGVNPFLRLFLKLGADVNAPIGPWGIPCSSMPWKAVSGTCGCSSKRARTRTDGMTKGRRL